MLPFMPSELWWPPEEYCYGRDDASSHNDHDLGCRHCGIKPYGWNGLAEFGYMGRDGSFYVDKDKLVFFKFKQEAALWKTINFKN